MLEIRRHPARDGLGRFGQQQAADLVSTEVRHLPETELPAAFAAANTAATVFREQPSTSAMPRWLTPSARNRRICL